MKLLTCLSILTLVAFGEVAAAPSDPYAAIERQELTRSPGGQTLAGYLERGEPAVAARAALALGRTKKLLAADPLLQHTGASDAGVRAMVIYGLGLLADPLSVRPPATPAAPGGRGTPPPRTQAQTTVQVGGLLAPMIADRRDRAAAAIVGALDDGSDAVKIAAFDATGRFAAKGALNATLAARALDRCAYSLRADASPAIRGRAAIAIAQLGASARLHRGAFVALQAAFPREDDPAARWHVMWALERGFPKDLSRAFLQGALRDRNEIVRIQAIRAVARAAQREWVVDLTPLLEDASWRVAEEAHEAILFLQTGKRTDHLSEIPDGISPPAPQTSPSSEPAALPRPAASFKPAPPALAQLNLRLHPLPRTVAAMTGPVPGAHPRVRIRTTKGTIVLVLFPEWAPSTVANFLNLVNAGYYDGLRWFRIVPDFVVQTGDKHDDGEGDAGYRIPAEENPLEQDAGVVSMGLNYDKSGPQRDSAGTQFYITISPQLHLNQDFTVFGRVESGFDVLGLLVETDRMTRVEQISDTTITP